MLYLTTRGNMDAYTAHKTMVQDVAPDGGMFVPFQIPYIDNHELSMLIEHSYGENVADILNRFYSARLSGWSVDFAIGRSCLQTVSLSQKIIAAELWHNPENNYHYVTESLFRLLSNSNEVAEEPTNWALITIKIAALFGAYAAMRNNGFLEADEAFDVSVNVGDFADPIAVLYAKRMGLPVSQIICSCDETDGVWDLIHRGQIATSALPAKLALGLERLIYHIYGASEAERFYKACADKKLYMIDPESDIDFSDTFFCAVMGQSRADAVMNSIKRTDNYAVSAPSALAYGAIQDYRAKTGENRLTLLFSNEDPS